MTNPRGLPSILALSIGALSLAACAAGDPVVSSETQPLLRGEYLGCFTDDSDRALPIFLGGGHTIDSCMDAAAANGLAFAGVQFFGECWGGDQARYDVVSDGECNTPCDATQSQICGGAWRNSIYATGVTGATSGDPLSQMARIGGDGDAVAAYIIHTLQNTEFWVDGTVRTMWDMIDHNKFMVALGNNGSGINSYRVFFHYTGEGHQMISRAQFNGFLRYRSTDTGEVTFWIGFTQGGIFDPTLAHPDMDHSFKSLFEESGKDLCLQPQWNDDSTVGELDIDFHRQLEVEDHNRLDNSDPLTTCSGGCKNNNATYLACWGSPAGLPAYSGPMTVSQSDRGPVYNFHEQRDMAGYPEVANVLAGRGIAVATGSIAVPR